MLASHESLIWVSHEWQRTVDDIKQKFAISKYAKKRLSKLIFIKYGLQIKLFKYSSIVLWL
jgi:hypothetical protein